MESRTQPAKLDAAEYEKMNSALMKAFDLANKRLDSSSPEIRSKGIDALPRIIDTIMRLRDRAPR
jgi:hypothetical protein